MTMVKPNVAVTILDSVRESFDLFGDGDCAAILAKEGGGAAVMGGGYWVRRRYCLAGIMKLGEQVATNTKLE